MVFLASFIQIFIYYFLKVPLITFIVTLFTSFSNLINIKLSLTSVLSFKLLCTVFENFFFFPIFFTF